MGDANPTPYSELPDRLKGRVFWKWDIDRDIAPLKTRVNGSVYIRKEADMERVTTTAARVLERYFPEMLIEPCEAVFVAGFYDPVNGSGEVDMTNMTLSDAVRYMDCDIYTSTSVELSRPGSLKGVRTLFGTFRVHDGGKLTFDSDRGALATISTKKKRFPRISSDQTYFSMTLWPDDDANRKTLEAIVEDLYGEMGDCLVRK